jgi:hypothetical protein
MGESGSAACIDLEKGAVESDEAAIAEAIQDAITVGLFLGGLLLVIDFLILLYSGLRAVLATAIVLAAVVLCVMGNVVRNAGPYPEQPAN